MRRRELTLAIAAAVLVLVGLMSTLLERGAVHPLDAVAELSPDLPPLPPAGVPAAPPVARASVTVPPDARIAFDVASQLAALGPRTAGSDGDEAGRRVTVEALHAAGWTVLEEDVVLPQGGTTANVVAWRGEQRPGAGYVVVGAHHDTVPGSPGANDNGSGVGVLVALADRLADEDLPLPVVLVAFGAEERQPSGDHHVGSEAFAARHATEVVAMVSVDMVGNTAIAGSHCICWFAAGPRSLADRLADVAVASDLPVHLREAGAISDHAPFARRGVPAVLLWSGPDIRYHAPTDTAEHLRVDDLRVAARLVATWLRAP